MCIENGFIYIGKTQQTFMRRFYEHSERLTRQIHDNSPLQRAFNKYGGDKFIFFVIESVTETDDINELERRTIEIAREHFSTCVNMLDGGEADHAKLGKLNAERLTGSKLSKETREKMSRTRKGRKHDLGTAVKTRQENYFNGRYGANKVMSPATVIAVKKLLSAGVKQNDIAAMLGVSRGNIAAIAREIAWKFIDVPEFSIWRATKQKKVPSRQSRAKPQDEEGVTTIRKE